MNKTWFSGLFIPVLLFTLAAPADAQQSAQDLVKQGDANYEHEDYAGALADYDHAIQLDPANAAAYTGRGDARRKTDDPKGALEDYNHVINLAPSATGSGLAYGGRALLNKDADIKGALADANRAVELEPPA